MVAITKSTSLTFLKDELDSTLSDAERHLEAWSQDHGRTDALEGCLEGLRQMAGMAEIASELPLQAPERAYLMPPCIIPCEPTV